MVVDAVVKATIDLFRRRDDDSLSVREIAERAGVGTGSVYDYFEGRQGVLAAAHERVTRDNFDELLQRWRQYDGRPIEDAMIALLDDTMEHV